MSVLGDLIISAIQVAETDKAAILAELQVQNGALEALITSAIKDGIKNELVASLVVKFLPAVLKDLPQIENAAFEALVVLATKVAGTL